MAQAGYSDEPIPGAPAVDGDPPTSAGDAESPVSVASFQPSDTTAPLRRGHAAVTTATLPATARPRDQKVPDAQPITPPTETPPDSCTAFSKAQSPGGDPGSLQQLEARRVSLQPSVPDRAPAGPPRQPRRGSARSAGPAPSDDDAPRPKAKARRQSSGADHLAPDCSSGLTATTAARSRRESAAAGAQARRAPPVPAGVRERLHAQIAMKEKHAGGGSPPDPGARREWLNQAAPPITLLSSVRHHPRRESGQACALLCIVLTLAVIVLLMVYSFLSAGVGSAGLGGAPPGGDNETAWKPAPDLELSLVLAGCIVGIPVALGLALRNDCWVHHVRGLLETTTVQLLRLERGTTREPILRRRKAGGATKEERALADAELEAETAAELMGWTRAELEESRIAIKGALGAPGGDGLAQVELDGWRAVAWMHWVTLKTTFFGAHVPAPLAVTAAVMALAVVAFGALGFFLTVGAAHMPDPRDDAVWRELSWQAVNAVFVVIALWRTPQRLLLMHRLVLHTALTRGPELEGRRTRLAPGVLLQRRHLLVVAVLRLANLTLTFLVCFFMWAWLPRCLQEERVRHADCTSRPGWAVPVFLVLAMGSDITGGAMFNARVAKCDWIDCPPPPAHGRGSPRSARCSTASPSPRKSCESAGTMRECEPAALPGEEPVARVGKVAAAVPGASQWEVNGSFQLGAAQLSQTGTNPTATAGTARSGGADRLQYSARESSRNDSAPPVRNDSITSSALRPPNSSFGGRFGTPRSAAAGAGAGNSPDPPGAHAPAPSPSSMAAMARRLPGAGGGRGKMRRVDPTDGCAYTKHEFRDHYGGYQEWHAAGRAGLPRRGSADPASCAASTTVDGSGGGSPERWRNPSFASDVTADTASRK